jgi:hypothetical protein
MAEEDGSDQTEFAQKFEMCAFGANSVASSS